MDPREVETLVQRLIANPHDEQALAVAHQRGSYDPRSYALLLERVAQGTADPVFAAHWYSEAATVWSTVLGDQEQGLRALHAAAQRDPSNAGVVDRLAGLFRERGDLAALADLLERMVEATLPQLADQPDLRGSVVAALEELGRMYGEGPLARTDGAIRAWVRLADVDPRHAYAIYYARELLKRERRFAEALPFFAKEQALIDDPQRKMGLLRDEVEVRKQAGDARGATEALRQARAIEPNDPALVYEFGLSVVERIDGGGPVDAVERQEASQALLGLAETYDGEYGMNYALAALKATPGNDRAMQLADYYAEQLGRARELAPAYRAYAQAAPAGFMAEKARAQLGAFGEALPATPLPSAPESSSREGAPVSGAQPSGGYGAPAAMPSAPVPLGQAQPAYGQPQAQPGAGYPAAQAPAMVAPQAARPAAAPAAAPVTDLPTLLMQASDEAAKGRKPQAFDKYREVLALDPANPEALGWVQDFLHQRRKFTELRDVLLAAARVPTVLPETRKDQLRQVAGICESKLRDFDTAISALKQITQIDRGDHEAREQLCNLLERQKRWDDLAPLLEQQAMSESDVETKIAIEKKVAQLHEKQRGDAVAAAEAWVRIAGLAAGDESAIHTAVRLFEQGGQLEAAANAIMENLTEVGDGDQKAALYDKLGELRGKLGDKGGAGDAYAQAAELTKKDKHYELSVRFYAEAERFADAAQLGEQRASLFDGKRKAELLSEAAQFLRRADNAPGALSCYEQASDLDPPNDAYAAEVEALHLAAGQQSELVVFLLRRGEKLPDKAQRVTVRHRASAYQRSLGDEDGARETMLLILKDGEDREALEALHGWAEQRRDFEECVDFLKRLTALATTNEEKLGFAMREAQILADGLGDLEGAIARYEALLKTIDPRSRPALRAMSELEERRGNLAGAAAALERELELVEGPERATIAAKLAQHYEGPLDDARAAVRVLDIVHAADPEDFEAVGRLQRLCERLGEWPRVAHLLGLLIEVEGDEEEASNLTRQLASVVHERLGKGDEALAVLEKLADQGDVPCQQAYVELGLKLGWKGIVATKLVAWNESVAGSSRMDALRQAFMLFVEVGRDADALTVGLEVARSGGADFELAGQLETIAVRLRDLEALALAQSILVKGLVERARADEFVRQAEVMVQAGADPNDAIQHGEQGLAGIDPNEVDGYLRRLVALSDAPGHQIDVYERQVMRCKQPPDRIQALARAAQIAAEKGSAERARDFFNAALTGGATDEALGALEDAARAADQGAGGTGALLRTLAESLAAGGQGSRDGGRTRSALLRRAGHIALRDLGDLDRAFGWLGESIVAHVDDAALASLDDLGAQVGDMRRVEAALSRALEEVYDGPLVRKLLRKRATLRKDVLRDYKGAAGDLKRLHDLAPADQDLIHELSEILTHLRDHRGMIELYEDQILRGRDPQQRAEVARKVARIWEEYLADAREAGDAWRRVLRMKPGDKEAQAGLDRAKAGKLKQAPPLPPLPSQPPPPVSVPVAGSRPPHGRATAPASSPPREEAPAAVTPTPEAVAPAPEPFGAQPHGEAQGYPQVPAYGEAQGYPAAAPAAAYEGAPQAPAYEGQAGYPAAPAYGAAEGYPHPPAYPAQPGYQQPGYQQPGYEQPGYQEPGYPPAPAYEGQPAPEIHGRPGPADAPPAYPPAPPEGGQPGAYAPPGYGEQPAPHAPPGFGEPPAYAPPGYGEPPAYAPPGYGEPPGYAPPGFEQPVPAAGAYPYAEGAGVAPGYAPPPLAPPPLASPPYPPLAPPPLASPPYPPMAPPPVAPQGAPPSGAPGAPVAPMPGFPHLAPDAPEGLDLDDDDGVELIEEGPGAEPRQS